MRRLHVVNGPDAVPRAMRDGLDPCGRVESEFRRFRGNQTERTERINLGLALLQKVARPGMPLAYDDIAAWCGCSAAAIQMIERKALHKLRNRLRYMTTTDPRLAEMVDSLFYAREPAVRTERRAT